MLNIAILQARARFAALSFGILLLPFLFMLLVKSADFSLRNFNLQLIFLLKVGFYSRILFSPDLRFSEPLRGLLLLDKGNLLLLLLFHQFLLADREGVVWCRWLRCVFDGCFPVRRSSCAVVIYWIAAVQMSREHRIIIHLIAGARFDVDTHFCELFCVELPSLLHHLHSFHQLDFLFFSLASHRKSGIEHFCLFALEVFAPLFVKLDFLQNLSLLMFICSGDSIDILKSIFPFDHFHLFFDEGFVLSSLVLL